MSTFVQMYHPLIPGTATKPVWVALKAVDEHEAKGWVLVDPDVEIPDPVTPYYTRAETLSQVQAGTGSLGVALRAAFDAWGGGSGVAGLAIVGELPASPVTGTVYIVTGETSAPTPPSALTLTATPGNGQVTISAAGGAGTGVTYALYRGATVTGSPIATTFPFTDTGRTNGTPVSYIATATNAAGTVSSAAVTATPAAPATGGAVLASDNFTRANSIDGLSTSSGGQSWAKINGIWGISNNTAYWVNSAKAITGIDVGQANVTVKATAVGDITASHLLAFRIVPDGSDYWVAGWLNNGNWFISRGNETLYTNAAGTLASGDVLEVTCAGSTATLKVNGTQVLTNSNVNVLAATIHGFEGSGPAAAAFDDFLVTG